VECSVCVLLVVRIVLGKDLMLGFNVDLVLLGMLLFFLQDLSVLHDCISWIFIKLFVCFIRKKVLLFLIFFLSIV